MFDEEGVVKDLENYLADYRAKQCPNAPDLKFSIWVAIILSGLVIASLALGVGIDPDVAMLTAP